MASTRFYVNTTPPLRLRVRPAASTLNLPIGHLSPGVSVYVDDDNAKPDNRWYSLIDNSQDRALNGGYVWGEFLSSSDPFVRWEFPFSHNDQMLHGSAGGWPPGPGEIATIRRNGTTGVFIPAYNPSHARDMTHSLYAAGVRHFMIRATGDFRSRNPIDFVNSATPGIRAYMNAVYYTVGAGYPKLLQLHNEPNLVDEGLGQGWNNGREFNSWFLRAAKEVRARFPGIKIGFPALSPGGDVPNIRAAEGPFIAACREAIAYSDFLTVHYYWSTRLGTEIDPPFGMWRTQAQGKPIVGTEIGPGINQGPITGTAALKVWNAFKGAKIPLFQWLLYSTGYGAFMSADWSKHNINVHMG